MKRHSFTLIELAVVVAIMMLGVGLSGVAIRALSSPRKFDQAVREFQSFCVSTRSQAMELGRDRVVYFNPRERRFHSGDPERTPAPREEETIVYRSVPDDYLPAEENPDDANYEAPANFASPVWQVPEEFELDDNTGIQTTAASFFADNGGDAEEIEVFRFCSDGGASGLLRFKLTYRDMSKIFQLSPLTGRLLILEADDAMP